jgi:uracil-DNA glycosylase family 4
MSDEFGTEVSLLLLQAREYARYFGELGADVIDPTSNPASHLEPAVIIADPTIVESRVSKPSAAPQPTLPTASSVSPQFPRAPSANITHASPQDSLFAVAEATGAAPQSTETLEDIWADIGECTRCGLCAGRTQVVNTHGNPKARLMFVGEAPGADEDAQGKPFVGRAGQLLTKMIEAMGMKREDVIIGNVNRCRPPGNRQPTLEEAAICRPFLFREIAAVRPEVIVVMGNTALRNLLEIREGITRVRGQFQDFQGIKVMPTFHPAYLLRDPSKKRETWDDLKKVMEYLDSRPNQR